MERLREIIKNPIGIAVAVVHWIVVIFTLLFDDVQRFKKSIITHDGESLLFEWLQILNFIPLMITAIIFDSVSYLFAKNRLLEEISFFVFVCCSTFQWLLIGYLITKIAESRNSRKAEFSLKQ